jgi:hypothetical protein
MAKYPADLSGYSEFDLKYLNVTFKGSTFPDKPYQTVPVKLTNDILNVYIPARDKVAAEYTKGFKLLITIMALQEGFYKGSRSFKSNNPGNIGNDDSGKTTVYPTLEDGIKRQITYIQDIVNGKSTSYPMGKLVDLKPGYSKEIDNHPEYGLPCFYPGYQFTFTGQLDQFVKIYSTGARLGNGYINRITSYFKENGLFITPESKIQDIIKMN